MKFNVLSKLKIKLGKRYINGIYIIKIESKLFNFSIDWFTDFGEWFIYIRIGNKNKKWWRFSSVGYMSYKE